MTRSVVPAPGRCLFSAPFSFLGDIGDAYQAVLPTVFREVWERRALESDRTVTAWVMNPGQRFVIDDAVLDLFPALTVLVTPSTGSNHIDIAAATRRGIPVYSLLDDRAALDRIAASAEFTFLLLLNTLRRLDRAVGEVSARRWRAREDLLRGHELAGRLVGLVGFGRIGRRVARYCAAFDADVVYHDPYVSDPAWPAWPLDRMFAQADAVCLCCRLSEETTGLVDARLLRQLKAGACLVNTSRGEVLVEADLVAVLGERPDLHVGLDVLAGEVTDTLLRSPLLEFHDRGQIVITPHIAGATVESQRKAALAALALLERHLAGPGAAGDGRRPARPTAVGGR